MLSYKGSWAEYTVYIMMLVEALMTKKGMSLVRSVTCYTSLGQTKKEKDFIANNLDHLQLPSDQQSQTPIFLGPRLIYTGIEF